VRRLEVNKADQAQQRLISMAQTAYEEAGMWAVKAITEGIVMAHTDKTYKTLCTKINTEGRLWKTEEQKRIQITSQH
jgi:hypothetical protein